ncbi:MAG: hypothetical protein AAF501_00400 [Pseudomonadota bacterium]
MPDNSATKPAVSHDTAWELIPWYVNGSLPGPEASAIASHSEECDVCKAEIEHQRDLAAQVEALEVEDPPTSRSWQTLQAQIAQEDRTRKPVRGFWGTMPSFTRGIAIAGATAVLFVAVLLQQPTDDGFQTLTNSEQTSALGIKFQTSGDVDPAALRSILSERGLTLVEGPSEGGVYRVVAAEGSDLDALAAALITLPEIAFAAPETLE